MPIYDVTVEVPVFIAYAIEAETEDDAIRKAREHWAAHADAVAPQKDSDEFILGWQSEDLSDVWVNEVVAPDATGAVPRT